jgi:hypothetical protein
MSYFTSFEIETWGELSDGADVDEDGEGRPRLVAAATEFAADFFNGSDRDFWIAEVRRLVPAGGRHDVRYSPLEDLGPFLCEFTNRHPSLVVGMRGFGERFGDVWLRWYVGGREHESENDAWSARKER